MKPAEDIKSIVKNLRVNASPDLDKRVYHDLAGLSNGTDKQRSASGRVQYWRTIMKSPRFRFAAAAAMIIAAAIYFMVVQKSQSASSPSEISEKQPMVEKSGPQTYNLSDGSTVKLAAGAKIRVYEKPSPRGFEHCAGEIEVNVAKGPGEFVVNTALGRIKALGTVFTMDLIDAKLQNTSGNVKLLQVRVKQGRVEVSNDKGMVTADHGRYVTVEPEKKPYDFRQDASLPPRLVERIRTMLDAMEAGDKKAYIANYNIKALYDLAKGNIKFEDHRDWFSGMSPEDAKGFIEAFRDVQSTNELVERMMGGISDEKVKLYVREVTLRDDTHAAVECVKLAANNLCSGYTPQWTYFDNDWWQTDD
jgi:hypothetical protein